MKCPECGGVGRIHYGEEWCSACNGTGEVQTNEEWLRSATFDELAGAIYEWHTKGYARGKNGLPLNSITEIVEWLKEKHE